MGKRAYDLEEDGGEGDGGRLRHVTDLVVQKK